MGLEDFIRHIENAEIRDKRYEKKFNAFSKKLPRSLTAVVLQHIPEAKGQETRILEIANEYISHIWELYNRTYSLNTGETVTTEHRVVEKPQTKEEAKVELIKELKDIPRLYRRSYTKVFWEEYRDKHAYQTFKYAIYEAMKNTFTACYLDDVLEWDSDALRYFDRSLYWHHAFIFELKIRELLD